MPDGERDRFSWTRYSSLGFEFVASFAVFAALGYWVDTRWDSSPWGLVVGAALGLIGASYNLVKTSLAAFKRPVQKKGAETERDSASTHGEDRSNQS